MDASFRRWLGRLQRDMREDKEIARMQAIQEEWFAPIVSVATRRKVNRFLKTIRQY